MQQCKLDEWWWSASWCNRLFLFFRGLLAAWCKHGRGWTTWLKAIKVRPNGLCLDDEVMMSDAAHEISGIIDQHHLSCINWRRQNKQLPVSNRAQFFTQLAQLDIASYNKKLESSRLDKSSSHYSERRLRFRPKWFKRFAQGKRKFVHFLCGSTLGLQCQTMLAYVIRGPFHANIMAKLHSNLSGAYYSMI